MDLDPKFGIPCLDGTDAAALALYLQRLAETVEAQLLIQRVRIRSAYRRKCAIWRNASIIGPISTSGSANVNVGPSEIVFSNYTDAFGQPPGWGGGTFYRPFQEAGLWACGYSVRATELGGLVTNPSTRFFDAIIQKHEADVDSVVANVSRYMTTAADSGEFSGAEATFLVGDDFLNYGALMAFTHNNAAAQVQINVRDFMVWVVRIGSADELEVT